MRSIHAARARYLHGEVESASGAYSTTVRALADYPGLILGGALAAPIAAYVAKAVPDRLLMLLVGAIIMLLSVRGLLQTLG